MVTSPHNMSAQCGRPTAAAGLQRWASQSAQLRPLNCVQLLADASAHMKLSTHLPRRNLMRGLAAIGLWPLAVCSQAAASASSGSTHAPMMIRMVSADRSVHIALDANAAARDFVALLPLTLTLEDYAATEKIATLPRKLSTAGAPAGTTPVAGDFSYYAPWGNLAIFHKPFRYSEGLIRLGRIERGMEVIRVEGRLTVRIELVKR